MKKQRLLLVICLSVFFIQGTWATNYYFSSENGNDANSGTSSGSPKQTVSAMQTVINNLVAGDNVYLERGSVWYETSLTISSKTGTSGSPIVFDVYGSGANPVLSGQKILSSPSQSGNIYTFTDGDIPNINLTSYSYGRRVLGYVTLGGTAYNPARQPNSGYYTSSSCSSTSLTDDLSWSTNQWQDGWIAMKILNYQWSLARVSSNTSTTLTHTQHVPVSPSGTKHYFFINAYNAMDQDGEWFWDDGSLSVYWAGTLPEVKVSIVDNIVSLSGSDYIYFNNIDFIGANINAIAITQGDYNKLNSCRIIGAGQYGVKINGSPAAPPASGDTENNQVTYSEIADCGMGAIFSRYARGGIYTNNYIHRVAIIPGYQNKTENNYVDAYSIVIWNNLAMEPVVQQNFMDSIQAGVTNHYNGSTLKVRENYIRNYGMGDLGDLGGFYVVSDTWSSANKKRINKNFFVDNHEPSAASLYENYSDSYTHAVYFDQDSYGCKGDSNSIENAQIAFKTNGGVSRSFKHNNILYPLVYSSIHEEHECALDNSYNFALASGIARADTITYNNVVFGTLGEKGYKFSRVESTYSCSLPYQGEIDYNKWFDPSNSSPYVAAIYDQYNPDGTYTISQWQSFSENCSGDSNDPGDNSSYSTSYTNPVLLKNWSSAAHTFTLSASYVDVDGNTVTGSTSVPAFYSKLLFRTSGTETNSDIYADTTLVPNLTSDIVGGDTGGDPTSYALTISYAGTGSGSVSPGSGSYTADTTISLTATPNSGSIFAGWSGDTTATTNPLSVVMWTSKSITATFTDTTSVPESDTIAYWRFENNANDEMGNYDATLYGSPTYESSSPAEGTYNLNLDGSGRYANCGSIELGSSFSISGYVKISGTSGTRPLFATTSASSPDGIYATVNMSTGVFSLITGNGSSSATATSTTGNYSDWTWIKYEYVVDCTANTCHIYIDDEDESSSTTIVGDFTDNKTFYIGRDAAGTSQLWGRVDAVMIVGNVESEPDPVVTIVATDPNASEEGPDNGVFTFSRGTDTTDSLTVSFTVSGTATTGTDFYPSLYGFVIIPDGQSSTTITIQPVDDEVDESDETVTFTLTSGTGYTVGTPSYATITIADNDTTIIPESDTIAYWRFENNAYDEMGNYDATLYGSPSYESSSPAEGTYNLSLDGSGRYANCGSITLGSSFSISGYVKISGTSGTRPLFATTSASSPDGIYATVNMSTGVFSLITGDGSSSATATSTTGNYSDWTWIKYEYIVDCDANTCNIYIDDEDESSSTTIVGGFTDNKTFYIGRDAAGTVQLWGRVDATMIVSDDLSRAKIRSGKLAGDVFEPISYYPVPVADILNLRNVPQNSIITVYDIVGNRVITHKTGLGSDVQLNVNGLKSGIYLFRVIDETSTIKGNFKVVKK